MKKFSSDARYDIDTKIFLPQRNRAVYNGLQPAKMKIFYHEFFLMNISNH